MAFTIETYDRKYLPGMIAVFNQETAFETHIAKLDPQMFIDLVEAKSHFDPTGLFVAVESGKVLGWVHACYVGWQDAANKFARIRMLIFPRTRMDAGTALVAAANAWLEKTGATEMEAVHARNGYPFYRGIWMGGEPMGHSQLPHVQVALEVGGYKLTQESICMTARMDAAPKVAAAKGSFEYVQTPAQSRPGPETESWGGFEPIKISCRSGDKEAGNILWFVEPQVAPKLGAPCMNIYGLWVYEDFRRKNIGTALVSRAMAASYAMGARHCSVSTQLWNAPAHGTYGNMYFTPHVVVVGRARNMADKTQQVG